MSSVWFYTFILSFSSGIFLRSFFVIGWPGMLWVGCLGTGLFLILWRRRSKAQVIGIWIVALCFAGSSLGMFRVAWDERSLVTPSSLATKIGENSELIGTVVREPDRRAQSTQLTVLVETEKILVLTDRHTIVRYGDVVTLRGKLTAPQSFVTDLGREFDYPGYLQSKGIHYVMSFGEVEVERSDGGNRIFARILAWKEAYMNAVKAVVPEPEVGLGLGLILGVKQALGDELETAFRQTGVIHIVVLSGYNIMIIVGFVMTILARILPLRLRVIAGIISIVVFALLVGAGASVIRASIMASIALAALALGRRYVMMRALCIAGFIMLLINPLLLVHDVGFQLSFMATLGLILVAPQFEVALLDSLSKIGVKEFLIATLATQVAVLPLLLYHIGEFSVVALVVNVLVLPLVPLAMLATFVAGLVALVSVGMALPFALVAYGFLTYIINVVMWFASLPYAALSVPSFPFILVPLMYACIGYGIFRKFKYDTCLPVYNLPSDVDEWTIEVETIATKKS